MLCLTTTNTVYRWVVTYGLTVDTDIFQLQVILELVVAGRSVREVGFDDGELAAPPARAGRVENGQHVDVAPDEAEVRLHASAESHASVRRPLHHYDVVDVTATLERLVLADLRVDGWRQEAVYSAAYSWVAVYADM